MQQPPSMPPFSPAAGTPPVGVGHHAATPPAAPSPISSRPPEHQQQQQHVDELGAGGGSASTGGVAGSFGEHEGMSAGGDDGERGGPSGNRWPRQETLALLKIRSEMDAAFREAALKGPLWEQVSRKLEAMGYKRSAKKCREKFENVDKYYKRTKDGRAGRGDGKAYRFFSELEALHGANSASNSSSPPVTSLAPTPVAMAPPVALLGSHGVAPPAMHAEPPPPPRVVAAVPQPAPPPSGGTTAAATMAAATGSDAMTPGDMSFSSGSDTEETGGGKRKRQGGDGGGGGGKMMRFFEGLMRQVMERQEEMQQRFIEAMERREQDRMIREEAWRRQEVARLAREQDALAQERAMAASRDAAVVSFIQRVTGQTIPMPSVVSVAPPVFFTAPPPLQPTPVASAAPAAPSSIIQVSPRPPHAMPKTMTPQPQPQPQPQSSNKQEKAEKEMIVVHGAPATEETAAGSGGALSPSPSRWPKAEVHALIELRTELEARYQDSSPKGPLWEDISAAMRRRGYNRNAKRCKEKWENINKYFKKVKESNKKRPEDSKTCPYYHQLEALYRTKAAAAATTTPPPPPPPPPQAAAPGVTGGVLAAVPLSQQTPPLHGQHAAAGSNGNGNGCASSENGGSSGGMMQTTKATNGNGVVVAPNKQQEGMSMTKQAETPATEPRPQPVSMNDSYVNDDTVDSDSSMDDEDDFDDDDEEGTVGGNSSKMQYEIQFQRQQQQQSQSGVVVRQNASGGAATGPGPAAPTSGSNFLTMVHH